MTFKFKKIMEKLLPGRMDENMLQSKIKDVSSFLSTDISPRRFDIPDEGAKFPLTWNHLKHTTPVMRYLPFCAKDIVKSCENAISFHEKHYNEKVGEMVIERNEITDEELKNFEEYCKNELGILSIGYTRLNHNYIFDGYGILFDKVIVFTMKMSKEGINKAPSPTTSGAVFEAYYSLGKSTLLASEYLINLGFGTQSSHPLLGTILTPPLAVHAGLGWQGKHGLIVTPEHGPCIRLSAVFSNIENLPFFEDSEVKDEEKDIYEHRWIEEFCETCSNCVACCPTGAIYDNRLFYEEDMNLGQCIEIDKCFPQFVETIGCSICIKECMFNKMDYDVIKKRFMKQKKKDKKHVQ